MFYHILGKVSYSQVVSAGVTRHSSSPKKSLGFKSSGAAASVERKSRAELVKGSNPSNERVI